MSRFFVALSVCLLVSSVPCLARGAEGSTNGNNRQADKPPAATTPEQPSAARTQTFAGRVASAEEFDDITSGRTGNPWILFSIDGVEKQRMTGAWEEGRQVAVLIEVRGDHDYQVQVKGVLYKLTTRVGGPIPTPPAPTKGPEQEHLLFMCGKYAGDQEIEISVVKGDSPPMGPAPAYIESTYHYALGVSFPYPGLRAREFSKAPTTAGGKEFAIAEHSPGAKIDPVLTLSIYPGRRVLDETPRGSKAFFQLGTSFNDMFSTYYAGVGYELVPHFALTLGVLSGKVAVLAPGYHVGDPIGDKDSIPTVDQRRTSLSFGVTIGSVVWNQVFPSQSGKSGQSGGSSNGAGGGSGGGGNGGSDTGGGT